MSMSSSRASLSQSQGRKQRYRTVLDELTFVEDDNVNNVQRIEKTARAVQEVKSLLAETDIEERAQYPGEGYLDSRVLRATSDLAVRCSEAVSGNANIYDKHELSAHIRDNPDFWDFAFPYEAPPTAFLFGTFAPTPPEHRPRAPRRRVERQQAAALKAPETVDKIEKTEEGSEMVSRVNRFIMQKYKSGGEKPLSYFHVVLDPDSFSRTVENIYYLSFLVRDGMLTLEKDEKWGLPFVTPVPPPQQEHQDISEENQFIVSIDMHRWQELVQAFDIKAPMMVLKRRKA